MSNIGTGHQSRQNRANRYGYPRIPCLDCNSFGKGQNALRVRHFRRTASGPRVMLVGQDPRIAMRPGRVVHALMLDDSRSKLSRWLERIFTPTKFWSLNLYATNAVKCSFTVVPTQQPGGAAKFLQRYFANCQYYLEAEIAKLKPDYMLSLGETAHKFVVSCLDPGHTFSVPGDLSTDFTGMLRTVGAHGHSFQYSPCLHITQFQMAERGRYPTYLPAVNALKAVLPTIS